MEPLPTRGRLNGRVALSYTLVLKERKVGHEAPASQVRGFLLTAALIGDFDIHGARNEREETNAAGVPKGGCHHACCGRQRDGSRNPATAE